MEKTILILAEAHIRNLFDERLPPDRIFHNFQHTKMVVQGVQTIVSHLQLSEKKKEIVELAAWFHDAGHVLTYHGHEQESERLARVFLKEHSYPEKKTQKVIQAIEGTHMPQRPHTQLQRILCDADLFHLSQPEYLHILDNLRAEWSLVLHKEFSDGDWKDKNIRFLKQHRYFTQYGKIVLQKEKERNIDHLENGF